jgi:hypothetical protein
VDPRPIQGGLQTFLTYINPFNPSVLILCNARGGYVGMLQRTIIPSRADYEGIKRDMGAARKHEADMFRTIGLRHTDKAVAKTEMHRNNAEIIQQSIDGLTPADRRAHARPAGRGGVSPAEIRRGVRHSDGAPIDQPAEPSVSLSASSPLRGGRGQGEVDPLSRSPGGEGRPAHHSRSGEGEGEVELAARPERNPSPKSNSLTLEDLADL